MPCHLQRRRATAALLSALLLLIVSSASAAAGSCADAVSSLAQQHGIEPAVPAGLGESDPEISARELQRSGGVIAPPPTGDPVDIAPQTTPPMPTTPPVTGGLDAAPGDPATAAAATMQAESLLGSAIAASAQGDEAGCAARLAEARDLLATPEVPHLTPDEPGS